MISRKGSMVDIITIVIMVMAFAITLIISYMVLSDYNAAVTPEGINTAYADNAMAGLRVFNMGFVIIFVGSLLATLISAFMVRTHPVFFIISFLILGISIGVGAILSNVFEEFIGQSVFTTVITQFSSMIAVMRNLPTWIAGIGFALLIVLYARSRGGSEI